MMGRALSQIRHIVMIGIIFMLFVMPLSLFAQAYDNPGIGRQPVIAHPQDFKPLGIRAGSFMLHPGVELAGQWIDNVFYSYVDEEDDLIYHIRPYITAQSTWSKHSFNVRLAADIGRHKNFGFRDYEDYFLNIGGRVDVKSRSALNYQLDFMRLHEGLNTRSAEQGVKPTVYTMTGGSLGYDHTFNRMSVGVRYDHNRLDYDNTFSLEGDVIDNQDRDRKLDSLFMRLGYQFQTDMQAFVSGSLNKIEFKQEFDRNGISRSSEGYTFNAGLQFGITGKLSGDVFATYHFREYDDPTLPDIDGWAGGMGLTWLPTRLTTVRASITSSIQETTLEYASGYLGTLYLVRVDHELLRDLQISGKVSYRDNDYQLTPDAPDDARAYDEVWAAGVGATYFFNRNVRLSASYDYNKLSTNVPEDGFKVNRVWLVLGFEK
jgi:hypothetical protein